MTSPEYQIHCLFEKPMRRWRTTILYRLSISSKAGGGELRSSYVETYSERRKSLPERASQVREIRECHRQPPPAARLRGRPGRPTGYTSGGWSSAGALTEGYFSPSCRGLSMSYR